MGGDLHNPKDAPADCLATDSVIHHTSEVPVVTEPNGASSQSPPPDGNDAGSIESHESAEADDTEDDTATVTGREQDSSNAVAKEVQTVKANNQDPPFSSQPIPEMKKQPETRPISQEQLVAEAEDIYAGLMMVESKCIEVDANRMPPTDGPLDITRYLLMIPESKLILLQSSETRPNGTVRTWYIKVHKNVAEGDKKPSALESTKDSPASGEDLSTTPSTTTDTLPTSSKDCAAISEETSPHPHVSEKITPQVGGPEDYLHGFQVALESRAKELGWPEYEKIAAATTAEIGEEGRQKVIDGKYFLAIGYELVEQILRDLESAKEKAEKKAAEAKAEKEAAEAKAEQETAQAEEDNKGSNPEPEATPTSVGEMLDGTASKEAEAEEAEHAFKEAAPEEIAPEEVEADLEEVDREKASPKVADANADAALDEVTVTTQSLDQDAKLSVQEPQGSTVEPDVDADAVPEVAAAIRQHSAQNANLSAQERQNFPKEAGTAPADSGKDTADTRVDPTALTNETKSESEKQPKTELPSYVEFRQLSDQSLYKKVGSEYWVLIDGQWAPSLNAKQFAALVALHRTLLHEHHDYFSASQHPSASAALKKLAAKYAMPARMWRHGIQSFLEVMRKRLVESGEHMTGFIILAYQMMALLEETVLSFSDTWIEYKADLARYGMANQSDDKNAWQRWHDISKEEYTRLLSENPTTGRIYQHLAIMAQPRTRVSPDEKFEATVSQFFYYTKSLVVQVPFFAARESVLTLIEPIVARNEKKAEKPASAPQTDKDHFLTAVSHLILASLEPETLRRNGYKDRRNDHVQAVYAALEKIKIGASSKTSRIWPSPQLGLLLRQLLLGIPLVDQRWSPMMAAWAPDLVTAEDRADSDAMANARDIHDVTIELIRTMVPCLLEEADTRDLRLWGFIYVTLVFMRSLKTRPNLLEWLGSAFHAQLLAPFLNMLLREDETRGGLALESASQSELVTICSLLNEKKKLDKYGLSTEDSLRKYLREQEEQRKAELSKSKAEAKDATATPEDVTVATDDDTITSVETTSTAEEATVTTEDTVVTPEGSQTTAETRGEPAPATEETTSSDTAYEKDLDTKIPDWELMYANTLPEHSLLSGLFFAREAEPGPCDKSLVKPAGDAVVVACPAAPDATPAALQTATEPVVQTVEEPAVEQPQGVSRTGSKTDSKAEDAFLTDSESDNEEEYGVLEVPGSNNESQGEEQTKAEAMEASLVEVKREENENEDLQQQDAQTKEAEAEKTQEEDEQKAREAKEAEVRRQEGLHRDPPLFPNGWLKSSKYDYDEMQVRSYVQDAETYDARSIQLLRLAAQLTDHFFVLETDKEGRYWISVPGASSIPKPDPNKKMPEIIERDGGVRVVYVQPSFHTAEIERQKKRAAREEERQKEEERRREKKRKEDEAKATTDVATAVKEKAEGDAEEQPAQSEKPVSQVDAEETPEAVNAPAVAPSTVSENGDHEPSSAYEMDLDKAIGLGKATAAAEKPPVTPEAEPTEAEPTEAKVETTLPVRGSDAGPDAAAATAPAADTATEPQATVPLSEGVLDNMPRMENPTKAVERWRAPGREPGAEEGADRDEDEDRDEEEWECLSNESYGDAKVEMRSMFSRFL